MPDFNLVDEPWIPVDGGRLLSLRETFHQARELRDIEASSPLVTIAIYRLMLAILHRVFGPEDAWGWEELWQNGWDFDALDSYLDHWHDRFDLFHPEHPFYQVAGIPSEYRVTVTKLAPEYASPGNSSTLFDHSIDGTVTFTPAQAAGYLLAQHLFGVDGTITLMTDEPRAAKYADACPLTKTAVCLVAGSNLFETLMLNLDRYSVADSVPFEVRGADLPAWERDEPTRPDDRYPSGYLDLLTWQSRRIRLFPEVRNGQVVVPSVAILKGYQFPDPSARHGRETMLAFRKNDRAPEGQDAWPPVAFREDRALWRDSTTLFQTTDTTARPKTLDWLAELSHEGIIPRRSTLAVQFFGVTVDHAKVLFWRHERLPLPTEYLDNKRLLDDLREALEVAERVGQLFVPMFVDTRLPNGKFAKLPTPMEKLGEALETTTDRKPDTKAVTARIKHLAPGRAYWSRLETPFRVFLSALPADADSAKAEWRRQLEASARAAFNDTTRSLDTSAQELRAVALASRELEYQLRTILHREEVAA